MPINLLTEVTTTAEEIAKVPVMDFVQSNPWISLGIAFAIVVSIVAVATKFGRKKY